MKAIEILFERINELNTKIQQTEAVKDKVFWAVEIKETAQIIEKMHELSRLSGDYV